MAPSRSADNVPEGPQVARHARLQAERLVGKRIHADSPNGRSDEVAAIVDGKTLRGIEAIGKHLIYDFGLERYLHVHLGRFGKFVEGEMPLREPQGMLRFRMYSTTYWYELRGAIAIEMFDASMRALLENRIGPSPLDAGADPMLAYAKIVKSRAPIATLLMDQSIVAGIGNIYRCEVLFLNRVDPALPGNALAKKTWKNIWRDLERLMADGAKIGRIVTTWPKDRRKPTGAVKAGDRFYVYHRDGLPCLWCGTIVKMGTFANRNVYWCPSDQAPIGG